ncbi:MAG: ComEC/Rec2 family competence protein [Desulfomonilaceae bacterium]
MAKRPAFLTLGAFVIGIMIGYPLETVSNGVIITILLVALMALVGVLVGRCLFLAWMWGLVAFILIGAGITFSSRTNDSIVVSSNKKVVQATVSRVLSSNLDHRILLLKSGYLVWDRQSLPGYGRLSLRENTTPLMSGDRISFRSSIRAPVNRGNPGEYNWEVDCKSEGIAWLVSTHGPQSLVKLQAGCPYYPSALLSRLRRAMSAFIEKNSGAWFSERDAKAIKAIHKGIILGDRAEIDGELTKAFSNSGLVHMLSASGSHVTIVAAVTLFVVKTVLRMVPNIMLWLPLPKIAAFFCIPTISVYCLLVGLKPPAMRAGLVGITLAVALITDRRWDSMNSLAFSAILILLFYPLSIFTPSFQLSFAAVAGILIIVQSPLFKFGSWTKEALEPRLDIHWSQIKKQPVWSIDMLKRPIISLVVSSLAATMAITPLIIHIFHSIPVYSIPANLASDFALTLGLSIGLISTLIGVISPLVGVYLMVPADFFVWLVIKIAVLTEKLPYAALQVPNLGYFGLVLSCITTGVTFYYIMRPKKDLGFVVISTWIILVITLMVGQVIQENSDKLKVVFLNVGNGDSAYIKAPGSSGFFIDTGPKTP